MNHLEELCTEWLNFNGYFTRTGVRVGARLSGGWNGELDVVGYHPRSGHFLHIECSTDGWNWPTREEKFARKFAMGRQFAGSLFEGLELSDDLEQVLVHGFASGPDNHRVVGSGRLVTSRELAAEIMNGIPRDLAKSAVPESFPLLRTLQLAVMTGARPSAPLNGLVKRGEISRAN